MTAKLPIPAAAPPAEASEAASPRFTVLLGDEADAAEAWHQTARGLLGAQGVTTLVPRTGREALGLIEKSALGQGPRIHVAVLDQHMPVMGGLQILRRLQRDLQELNQRLVAGLNAPPQRPTAPRAPAVPPAILLADSLARGVMHEALTVQVFSVLPRPVQLDLLLDTLARALRRYYQNRWPERSNEE